MSSKKYLRPHPSWSIKEKNDIRYMINASLQRVKSAEKSDRLVIVQLESFWVDKLRTYLTEGRRRFEDENIDSL